MSVRLSQKRSADPTQTNFDVSVLPTPRNSIITQVLTREPRLGKHLRSSLQVLIKEKRRGPIDRREPLEHYAVEQLVQASAEIHYCVGRRTLDVQDLKDMVENLMRMQERILKLAPVVGTSFAHDIRRLILLVHDMACALQDEERAVHGTLCPMHWESLSDILMMKIRNVSFT